MHTRVSLQPAFILHSRPWSDTSLILNIFSREHGLVNVLARGVKRPKSGVSGLFHPFVPLLFSWSGKSDLPTLHKVETEGQMRQLPPKLLMAGFYLNELLIKSLEPHSSYTRIYDSYNQALISLADGADCWRVLINFEKELLQEIGYGFALAKDNNLEMILPDQSYAFHFGVGFVKESAHFVAYKQDQLMLFSGRTILALARGVIESDLEKQRVRRLLATIWQVLLGGKKLKSAEMLFGLALTS